MTELRKENFVIPAAEMNGESTLPPIAGMVNVQQRINAKLDEDDDVYLGYGFVDGSFPYRQQDLYGRELTRKAFKSVVLENEYLRARFLPEHGGKLWSLFDKEKGRELTFSNPVFRPANLGIRNAWSSGGIEWNFGMVGHHPFTCSTVFSGCLEAGDGTPVFRIYEYERIRACTYQVDFFLPEKSRVLLCRTRIVNPTFQTVPVYWWSNIAVPELKRGRVVVGAEETYVSRRGFVGKCGVPICEEGYDCTYPVNSAYAMDYFWKTHKGCRRYVSHLDETGYGLIQTSTERMLGRKLFVWGQGQGGDNWQEYLSGEGCDGRYVEIQAGLAQTQYECVPMPPKTAWEWLEAYGAMNAAGEKVHGSWAKARTEVEARLDEMISREELEKLLVQTKETIALRPATEMVTWGSGWGALENLRRMQDDEPPLSPHLDFGTPGPEQAEWKFLLENGTFPDHAEEVPPSYMLQREWTTRLEHAVAYADSENWRPWYHLGLVYYVEQNFDKARQCLRRATELNENAFTLYALAQWEAARGSLHAASDYAIKAMRRRPDDLSLAKECIQLLLRDGRYTAILEKTEQLPEAWRHNGRIQLARAIAYLETGKPALAEQVLLADGGLVVPDVREGENSVTDLWFRIEAAKAARDGREFKKERALPPRMFDFRMM